MTRRCALWVEIETIKGVGNKRRSGQLTDQLGAEMKSIISENGFDRILLGSSIVIFMQVILIKVLQHG